MYLAHIQMVHSLHQVIWIFLLTFMNLWGGVFFNLKDFLESELNRSVDLVTRSALKIQLKDKILSQTKFV